jgi:tetratricopeptide (TPR) repeat protein
MVGNRFRFAILAVVSLACASRSSLPAAGLDDAIDLIQQRQYSHARVKLTRILPSIKDPEERRLALFYKGLAEQNLAETAGDALRTHLYREAAADYEAALAIDAGSGGVLNNLARVYQALDDPRAEATFRQAIALTDHPDRPLYLKNFAAFLLAHGQVAEARRLEREAADLAAENRDARRQLLALHLTADDETFEPYLRQLIDSGAISSAEDTILVALARTDLPREQNTAFLVLLVQALRRDPYDPSTWSESPIAARMQAVASSNTAVAKALNELVELHRRPVRPATAFPWWHEAGGSEGRNEFGQLAARIAKWYAQRRDIDTATEYFRVAVAVGAPNEVSPDAILGLAETLYAKKDVEGMQELARYVEREVIPTIDGSSSRGRTDLYALHRSLGLILDELGACCDYSRPDSSSYQIAAMLRAAASYGRHGDVLLPVEPEIANEFVAGHVRRGDDRSALLARTLVAETYLAQGETQLALNIVQSTPKASLVSADTLLSTRFLRTAEILGVEEAFATDRPFARPPVLLAETSHQRYTSD